MIMNGRPLTKVSDDPRDLKLSLQNFYCCCVLVRPYQTMAPGTTIGGRLLEVMGWRVSIYQIYKPDRSGMESNGTMATRQNSGDVLVRSAKIKRKTSTLLRPISKIIVLKEADTTM